MVSYSFFIVVGAALVLESFAANESISSPPTTQSTVEPAAQCPDLQKFNITQINGTWYEYKRTTDFIGKGTCTKFTVICDNSTYCKAQVAESPQSQDIVITANSEDVVNATIEVGQNVMNGVHILTAKDSALLWQCEPKVNESGLMFQASIWHVAKEINDTQVDTLLKYVPDVNWDTVNQTSCKSSSTTTTTFSFFNILFTVIFGYNMN